MPRPTNLVADGVCIANRPEIEGILVNVRRERFLAPIAGGIAFLASLMVLLVTERRLRAIPAAISGLAVAGAMELIAESQHRQRLRRIRAFQRGSVAHKPRASQRTGALVRPPLGMLDRVVASGQQQTHGDTTIAVISIESYREGFILNLLISQLEPRDHRPENLLVPELDLAVHDDRDNRYAFRGLADGSEGGWRRAVRLTPRLDPAALRLTIDIAAIRWYRFDMVHKQRSLVRTEVEPWRFTVPLDSDPDEGMVAPNA